MEKGVVPHRVYIMNEFLDGIQAVIVMVGHSEIKGRLKLLANRPIVDPRNVMGDGDNVVKL